MAASYEARACGVRGAMGGRQALRAVPRRDRRRRRAWTPTPRRAGRCSRCSDDTTPLVEPLSIDEAFLDVGGLGKVSGSPADIAARAARTPCASGSGCAITVGVARTKFLAKVASRVAKPDGLLVVPPERELAFLHPLDVERAVGRRTEDRRPSSHERGITTVGRGRRARRSGARRDARARPRATTCTRSRTTATRARSRPGRRRRSMGAQRALGRGHRPPDEVARHARRAARRHRSSPPHRARRRPHRRPAHPLRRLHPRHPLVHAADARPSDTTPLRDAARRLLDRRAAPRSRRAGSPWSASSVANLSDADAVQLPLPFDGGDGPALDHALDAVRDRFGSSVGRARRAARAATAGWSMPVLPDG